MWQDMIVAEVRQVREAQAAQFEYDLRAIYSALKEAEQGRDRVVEERKSQTIRRISVDILRFCLSNQSFGRLNKHT